MTFYAFKVDIVGYTIINALKYYLNAVGFYGNIYKVKYIRLKIKKYCYDWL